MMSGRKKSTREIVVIILLYRIKQKKFHEKQKKKNYEKKFIFRMLEAEKRKVNGINVTLFPFFFSIEKKFLS